MNHYRDTLYSNYFSTQVKSTVADEEWTELVFSQEILPHFHGFEEQKIAELGCGHGNLLQFLEKRGFRDLQGCDLSDQQVELARKAGFAVARQSAQEFLMEHENWDVVVAIDVLEHLTKDEAVDLLKLIKNKLNKGGKLIFRVPNADAAVGGSYVWSDVTHELFLNAASAEQLFRSCGFSHVSVSGSYSKARGWKRFFSVPLRYLFEWKFTLIHLAYGVGSSKKIWTPNLIIVANL